MCRCLTHQTPSLIAQAALAAWVLSGLMALLGQEAQVLKEPTAQTSAASVAAADPDLPQPLDATALQQALAASPFSRVVDYSGALMLTGVASVNGKPIATVVDKQTKQHYVVTSDEPNARGWRLAGVSSGASLKDTSVSLAIGTETVTLSYVPPPQAKPQANTVASSSYGPSRMPTDEEAIRRDESGNAYVRGSVYLSDADRERYYNGFSREAHDRFRQLIRDNRQRMFSYTPEQRIAFSKKVFDHVEAEARARQQQQSK